MSQISIKGLPPDREDEAARVLARAFVTNPLSVVGPNQIAANEAFFKIGRGAMKGSKLVAVDAPRILGVIHWVYSPNC